MLGNNVGGTVATNPNRLVRPINAPPKRSMQPNPTQVECTPYFTHSHPFAFPSLPSPLGSHSPVWSQLRCAPISSYAVQTVLVFRVCVCVCAKWFQLTASACSNYSHAPIWMPSRAGGDNNKCIFVLCTFVWSHSHNVVILFLVYFIYWKIY